MRLLALQDEKTTCEVSGFFGLRRRDNEQDPSSIFGIDARMAGYSWLQARRQELSPRATFMLSSPYPMSWAVRPAEQENPVPSVAVDHCRTLLGVVLADRLHFGRSGSNVAQLRAYMRKQVETWQRSELTDVTVISSGTAGRTSSGT
jgi:hypothetical protein